MNCLKGWDKRSRAIISNFPWPLLLTLRSNRCKQNNSQRSKPTKVKISLASTAAFSGATLNIWKTWKWPNRMLGMLYKWLLSIMLEMFQIPISRPQWQLLGNKSSKRTLYSRSLTSKLNTTEFLQTQSLRCNNTSLIMRTQRLLRFKWNLQIKLCFSVLKGSNNSSHRAEDLSMLLWRPCVQPENHTKDNPWPKYSWFKTRSIPKRNLWNGATSKVTDFLKSWRTSESRISPPKI